MADFADHRLPPHGLDADAVLSRLDELAVDDRDWRGGRVFSLVYSAGDEVLGLLTRAANRVPRVCRPWTNRMRSTTVKTMTSGSKR